MEGRLARAQDVPPLKPCRYLWIDRNALAIGGGYGVGRGRACPWMVRIKGVAIIIACALKPAAIIGGCELRMVVVA